MKFVALIFIAVGAIMLIWEIVMVRTCDLIDGTVVEILRSDSSKGRTAKPEIQYIAKDGTENYYRPNAYTNPMPFKKMQKVKLLYDSKNNEIVGIGHFLYRFLFGYVFLLLGLSILLFSLPYETQIRVFSFIKDF
ncbi:MAG: DUF3592 domain-containing protein [Bacteroidota bacterium]